MTNKIILTLAMAFAGVTAINARNTSVDPISKTTGFEENLPVVITQNSTFLMPGQEAVLSVLANTKGSSRLNELTINGVAIVLKDGAATYKFYSGGLGVHEIPVKLSFFDKNDELQIRTWSIKYEVGQANASISLDKMNMLFIGVDNPVSIASATSGEITVTTEGGGSSITKVGAGQYNVRVTQMTDKCVIHVSVDGKLVTSSEFKVRNLPVPIATVGGYSSGDAVEAAKFGAQAGVGTYVKDFPVNFKSAVESYTVSVSDGKGETKTVNCEGAIFSAEATKIIKDAKSGSTVIIGNIMAKDEGGRKLKLAPIVYYIK